MNPPPHWHLVAEELPSRSTNGAGSGVARKAVARCSLLFPETTALIDRVVLHRALLEITLDSVRQPPRVNGPQRISEHDVEEGAAAIVRPIQLASARTAAERVRVARSALGIDPDTNRDVEF